MNAIASLSTTPGPRLSESSRLVKTFFAPTEVFHSLRQNPHWRAPWLLISAFSLVFSFIFLSRIDLLHFAQMETAKSEKAEQIFERLSPAAQQAQLKFSAAVYKTAAYLAPAITILEAALVAFPLTFAFNFFFKSKIRYSLGMAVVFYASLPQILFTIITCVALARSPDPDSFDLQNPIASNPAFFMNPADHAFLYGLARGLDVGNIWMIVLLGIGFAAVSEDHNLGRGVSMALVAALYILFVIARVAVAGLF